ncbi:MAG TPA: ABC transporter ATP-binding protein, partial [Afifellaceae bacterium]|nr:ABC transporter ATP-binding protein [Afifellaceae bacterium]
KRPKVLLLDEPLAALDRRLREETQFELSNIQEQLGLTFIIVTHDQEEAMTVADRIAVMDHGEVIQVATPAEIYEAPATRYIADFIGDVNLFHGVVYDISGPRVRLGVGADFIVETDSDLMFPPGAEAWFAIRPEKITLAPAKGGAEKTPNRIDGKIWDIGYLGDMTVYHVRLDDGAMIRVSQLNKARELEHPLSWDDNVTLSWSDDAGILLDR